MSEHLIIATRLREYVRNPHHTNPMSEEFTKLIEDAAKLLVKDYAGINIMKIGKACLVCGDVNGHSGLQ